MLFRQLFDSESSTYTYLIADPKLKEAILVDPVLEQVERDCRLLKELDLTLRYCLEPIFMQTTSLALASCGN